MENVGGRRQLSRRAMLSGAAGGAGAVGALRLVASPAAAAESTVAIPGSVPSGLARDLRYSLANRGGHAVAIRPGVGAVITFGQHLFHLDLRTNRLELFRRGQRLVTGRAETSDPGDEFKPGTRMTHRHALRQGQRRVELSVDIEQQDDAGRMHRLDVRAGVPGQPPSATLTALYDTDLRLVTEPRLSGRAPSFDFRPFQTAVELLVGQLAGALVVPSVTPASSPAARRAVFRCKRDCGVFSGLAALAPSKQTAFAGALAMWPWAGWRVTWNF